MRRLTFALVATAFVGCMSAGDTPSWRQSGLGGGRVAQTVQKAMDETDDEMQMHGDRPTRKKQSSLRPPSEDFN
ncbi:MAG: hypothetical protein K2R98_31155 [Gemmataceae bacterium]|nr:hypothetical protein [Gemmataceae bacterium]